MTRLLVNTLPLIGFDSSGSCWAATVATYCPGRMAELSKSKSMGGFYRGDLSPCNNVQILCWKCRSYPFSRMRIVGDTGMVGEALVGPRPVPSADVRVDVVGRDVPDHAVTEREAVLYRT